MCQVQFVQYLILITDLHEGHTSLPILNNEMRLMYTQLSKDGLSLGCLPLNY